MEDCPLRRVREACCGWAEQPELKSPLCRLCRNAELGCWQSGLFQSCRRAKNSAGMGRRLDFREMKCAASLGQNSLAESAPVRCLKRIRDSLPIYPVYREWYRTI